MICPNGHGEGQVDAKYCAQCGAKLIAGQTGKSKNDPYEMYGSGACPGCGFLLNHGHQEYCPGCGHQLQWTCR